MNYDSARTYGDALESSVAPEPITVVVAEPHPLTLRGIGSLFDAEGDIALAAGVGTAHEALEAVRNCEPNVVVLSLDLPDGAALKLLEQIPAENGKVRAVLLATRLLEGELLRALRLNVHGIVLKDMPSTLLLRCVRMVHSGAVFIAKDTLLRTFTSTPKDEEAAASDNELNETLTVRERDVVEHVVRGLSNKEVGRRLGLSEGTVKFHLHRVYGKLHVHGRFGLIRRNGAPQGELG